ncbi:MAG: formylglycine-generating enzyme family protein [Alphaproteobacteria bacterium]|nr:formylglycine-generating enzyme family protein [Alphaproteobacteria bacterium]
MVKAYLDREMTYAARREFGRDQVADLKGDEGRVLASYQPGRAPARPKLASVEPAAPAAGAGAGAGGASNTERAFWESATKTDTIEAYELYLGRYPQGAFVDLARLNIAKLRPRVAAVTPPSAPPRPQPAQPVQPAVGQYPAAPSPGQVIRDCPDCPEMVVVPAGRFTMGSPAGEQGRGYDEGPQRQVSVRSFALGKTEVTFAEWDACVNAGGCNTRPSDQGWGRGNRPVINVLWDDAKQYATWLSRRTGKQYRLPSEAEWEYAARAGTTTRFSCGDSDACLSEVAWYSANSGNRTQPVASKQANGFGLHDMHGNVWEWVEDCYKDSYSGAPSDGTARLAAESCLRIFRGGSWFNGPGNARAAVRGQIPSGVPNYYGYGFRIARTN